MPLVLFLSGAVASPLRLVTVFDLFAAASITSLSATTVTATLGQTTFTLTGTGMFFIGNTFLGGQVNGLTVAKAGVTELQTVSLGLQATDFQQAIDLERSGGDVGAMEHLILPLDWVYYNNFKPTHLLETDLSRDGVPLNFSGNDQYSTGNGNSTIYMGGGNDTGSGGPGKDRFFGGNGLDTLYGAGGDNTLDGGNGADLLMGGFDDLGHTRMLGGAGDDHLLGSLGTDDMRGGKGNDVFAFVEADGDDKIRDFKLGIDQIDLDPGEAFQFARLGSDTLLFHGTMGASVLLVWSTLRTRA